MGKEAAEEKDETLLFVLNIPHKTLESDFFCHFHCHYFSLNGYITLISLHYNFLHKSKPTYVWSLKIKREKVERNLKNIEG